MNSIDMAEIILEAYQLADELKNSPEIKEYLLRKKQMEQCSEAVSLIKEFQIAKEHYEEAKRFGIFHPNYYEAKERAEALQQDLFKQEQIRAFKEAEEKVELLLFQISRTIAEAISPSIKVPNDLDSKSLFRSKCGSC